MYWQRVLVREPRACFQIAGFRFCASTPSSRGHLIVFTQCDGLFHTRTATRLRSSGAPTGFTFVFDSELDRVVLEPARSFSVAGKNGSKLGNAVLRTLPQDQTSGARGKTDPILSAPAAAVRGLRA